MIGTMWIIGKDIYMVCPSESYALVYIGKDGDWLWEPYATRAAVIVKAMSYLARQPLPDNVYNIWTGTKIRRVA